MAAEKKAKEKMAEGKKGRWKKKAEGKKNTMSHFSQTPNIVVSFYLFLLNYH